MRIVVSLAAAAMVALTLPAGAASFDCAKAAAPDEIAICDNPALSALDSEMGGLWFAYSQIPFLMGMSGNRQDEARAFLETRAACGANVSCLTGAYTQRIATLKADLTDGMKQYCTQQ
ncbi:MAG: hypothetical protein J0H08_13090 [Rhizobiales bacterium]|nr:hypothetical protein [Hyphomicrobiales bacterium]